MTQSIIHGSGKYLTLVVVLLSGCLSTPTKQENTERQAELAATASPDQQQEGLAIVSAFEDWMRQHRVREGSIAISYQGSPVINKGIGRSAKEAHPVASLSKSITAVCLQVLLDQQGKDITQTVSDTMPQLLQQFPPADVRLGTITLAQLISHNSGIHERYHRNFLAKSGKFNKPQMRDQFQSLVKLQLSAAPGSGYNYNNANYLLLGLAVEALSDGDYEQVCRELVLTPLNIEASLHPRWRVMSSWGGWEISSLDYLKFLNAYFTNSQVMGKSPDELGINTTIRSNINYNLGVLTRSVSKGHRFWHSGSWRWKGNSRNDQFGAYFFALEDGLTVSINYSTHAQKEKLRDLENRLFAARK